MRFFDILVRPPQRLLRIDRAATHFHRLSP
jgi:hypothetical protein